MLPSLLILLRHCLPSLADERIRKVMATFLIYQRFSLLALVLHAAVDVLSSVVGNVSDIVQRSQQIAVDFIGGGISTYCDSLLTQFCCIYSQSADIFSETKDNPLTAMAPCCRVSGLAV